MSPEDVLRVAESLELLAQEREASGLDNEAELRSVVSRAYYAIFRSATQLIAQLSLHVDKEATGHQHALDDLNNSKDPRLRTMSSKLGELRKRRNEADYDKRSARPSKPTDWKEVAQSALDDAREFIEVVNEVCADAERCKSVGDAIRAYRKLVSRQV